MVFLCVCLFWVFRSSSPYKDVNPTPVWPHLNLTFYWKSKPGSWATEGNKRHLDFEGRNTNISLWKWYVQVQYPRKRLQNLLNKWVQQDCRMQDKYTKIYGVPYTWIESNKDIKKAIPFTVTSKKNKILWKEFDTWSAELLLWRTSKHYCKKLRRVLISWKKSHVGRLNIVRMVVLSKLIWRFSAIPVRISADFFIEMVNWI